MKNFSTQEYLSLGYIYLLILGIISDTVYYNFLGVSILDYSSISDVLISPLKLVAKNPVILVTLILIVGGLFVYTKWLYPFLLARMGKPTTQPTGVGKLVSAGAVMIMGFFLGIGIGLGASSAKKLKSGQITADHEITFNDQSKKEIRLFGRNSQYLFYAEPGGRYAMVMPADGNVASIRRLK